MIGQCGDDILTLQNSPLIINSIPRGITFIELLFSHYNYFYRINDHDIYIKRSHLIFKHWRSIYYFE